MADVVWHACFPTLIHEFRLDLSNDKMLNYVYEMDIRSVITGPKQDELHKSLIFKPLVDEITLIHNNILQKLEYEYEQLEITNMWANHLYIGDSHPPHTHSNNLFSGVYYLLAGSPIQFFDPRTQVSISTPRRKNNNPNNSNMMQFNSVQGFGYIFPAWLQHWVPPTQHERISVSWNILVRGNYGDPNTLQNAYI
jgi:uncharacterized protein (TIGR02466 family)